MKSKTLHLITGLFFILIFFQLFVGGLIFFLKLNPFAEDLSIWNLEFPVSGLKAFFRPDLLSPDRTAKSFIGIVEYVAPHVLSMSLLVFIMGHFVSFLSVTEKGEKLVVWGLVIGTCLYNLMPFLIVYHSVSWVWLSLISLLVFQLSFAKIFLLLIRDFKKMQRSY